MFTVIIKVIKARKTSSVGLWEINNLVKERLNWSFKKVLCLQLNVTLLKFQQSAGFKKPRKPLKLNEARAVVKHTAFISVG